MPNENLTVDQATALLRQQSGGQGGQPPPTVGPRTLTTDEVIRIMQDRQSGLSTVGQAVNALPEPMRNTIASTITTLAGVPFGLADIPHLAARGVDWSTDQLNRLAGITTPEYRTNIAAHVPPSGSAMTQDFMRRLGLQPTVADTTTGRIAQGTLGGAVGGATLGGGIGPTVARGAGVAPTAMRGGQLGLAGGLASEVAGEATRGTEWEIPARLAAGIVLPTLAAAELSRIGGAARTMGRSIDYTPQQLQHAQRILQDAIDGGHPVTVPEALAQAGVSGAGRLLVMQRLAEQQGRGAGRTFDAFRQYQARQGEQAINDVMDRIAPPVPPQNSIRYDVGVANQRSAEGVVRQAERDRTAAAGTAGYTAATPTPLASADVAPIIQRIRAIRSGPDVAQTGPMYQQLVALEHQIATEATTPGFTVGRLDEIYKQWRSRLEGSGMPGADENLRAAAVRLGPIIDTIRDDVLHLNPNYRAGSQEFARQSPGVERVSEGLPGAIAATPDPRRQIIEILSPNSRPDEVTRTLNAMRTTPPPLGGPVNPQAVNDLVRLRIDNALGDVSRFQGVVRTEQLGAKFNALLRSDPIAAANFAAALETVPNGTATLAYLNRLLDVFEAQGRRLNVGSPTDTNSVLRGMLTGNFANVLPVTRIPAIIQRNIDQWSYGRRLQDIADVSTGGVGGLLAMHQGRTQRSALPRGLLAADAVAVQRAIDEERRARQP